MTVDAMTVQEYQPWMDAAACSPEAAEMFFPLPADVAGTAAAKAICRTCPAVVDCLLWALAKERREPYSWGVVGGLDGAERRALIGNGHAA